MKIGGIDPSTLPNEELLVIPRGNQLIPFKAQGLPDMKAFEDQVKAPEPPKKHVKDQGWVYDYDNDNYKKDREIYDRRRFAYITVFSLAPSNIEWDTVKLDVPGTWVCWEDDMKKAGFSQIECNRIFNLCLEANSLSDAKLRKAREDFLAGPLPQAAA